MFAARCRCTRARVALVLPARPSPVAMPTRVCSEFSTRVNKPENDDPSIVEPIAIARTYLKIV